MTTLHRIKISPDDCPESPREWDTLGTMIGWHRRHVVGDEDIGRDVRDGRMGGTPEDALRMHAGVALDALVYLAVHCYEHGSVTYQTAPFACEWDSGQVGWIYTTRDKAAECFGEDASDERIAKALRAEVDTYNAWANGNVWGFDIEKGTRCQCCEHVKWEATDSIGGIYEGGTDEETVGFILESMPDEIDAAAVRAAWDARFD